MSFSPFLLLYHLSLLAVHFFSIAPISRSFKSALKKKFKENPELYEELIDMLTDEALTGRNLKAADMLLDLMGESVQRETLALKRKELKLKENAVKSDNPETAEEPMLYKALEGDLQ